MKIVICDDDEKCCRILSEAIQDYCRTEGIGDVEIYAYHSALDMLEQYPRDADIMILDVQMPAIDGIRAAREIRRLYLSQTMKSMPSRDTLCRPTIIS